MVTLDDVGRVSPAEGGAAAAPNFTIQDATPRDRKRRGDDHHLRRSHPEVKERMSSCG
jgi:hypothetical protein